MKIGLIINVDKSQALICGEQIAKLMIDNGAELLLNNSVKEINVDTSKVTLFDSDEEVIKNSDIAITVGGDGTIIHNAKYAATYKKPLIGVNMGRIGFVAGLEYYEIKELKSYSRVTIKSSAECFLTLSLSVEKRSNASWLLTKRL